MLCKSPQLPLATDGSGRHESISGNGIDVGQQPATLSHSKSRNSHLEAAARGYLVGEWYARVKTDPIEARQTLVIWRVFARFSVIYECNGTETSTNSSSLTWITF